MIGMFKEGPIVHSPLSSKFLLLCETQWPVAHKTSKMLKSSLTLVSYFLCAKIDLHSPIVIDG